MTPEQVSELYADVSDTALLNRAIQVVIAAVVVVVVVVVV